MYRKFKKAFTLVELVVVITIVAILSGVAVISYVGLTDNARNSKDEAVVSDLNTVLTVSSVSEKNNTFSDIIPDLSASGYDIEKLKPANTKHSFAWDSSKDRIVVINDSFDVVTPSNYKTSSKLNLFVICHTDEDITKYKGLSYYLASDYSAPEDLSMTHLAGIDVGTHTINKLSITDESTSGTILINTTSGIVDINTPNATVNHYGVADDVNITAVANQSYHLYGRINKSITIDKGRINVTNEGSTPSIVVNGNNIKIDAENTGSIGAIGVTKEEYKTSTEITQGNTRVNVEIEDAFNEYTQYFSGGDGSESFPYLISSAQEFINMRKLGTFTTSNTGINTYSLNTYYNFKLINDIDFSTVSYTEGWFITYYQGHIDGCNYKLISSPTQWNQLFQRNTGDVIFENLVLEQNDAYSVLLLTFGTQLNSKVIFKNITTIMNRENIILEYSHNASAFMYQITNAEVQFINCTNNSNINFVGNSNGGVFLGGQVSTTNAKITYINCVNNGVITGKNVGFFTGNSSGQGNNINIVNNPEFSNSEPDKLNIYLSNNKNNGLLRGTITAAPFSNLNNGGPTEINERLILGEPDKLVTGNIAVSSMNGIGLTLANSKLTINNPNIDAIKSYRIICSVSISIFNASNESLGSGYIRFILNVPVSEAGNTFDYYSQIMTSVDYEAKTSTAYANIPSAEQSAENSYKFKPVTLDGKSVMVVDINTILNKLSLTVNNPTKITISNMKTNYTLYAFDSDNYLLGSIDYKTNALES